MERRGDRGGNYWPVANSCWVERERGKRLWVSCLSLELGVSSLYTFSCEIILERSMAFYCILW